MDQTTTQTDTPLLPPATATTVARPRRGSRLIRGAIVFAALGLAGAGIDANSTMDSTLVSASTSRPRALAVETIQLERVTSFRVAREYTGTIVAQRISELSFERPGLLQTIRVDEGATVAAGSELATLDTEHFHTQRRETLARRAQAAALLAEMIAGPRQEDIDAARAQVKSLEAQVDLLLLQTARSRKLLQQNAIPQDRFDQYLFGLKARQGQLEQAQHELDELINGTRQEQIDAQQAIVEQLDAAVEDIDVDLRKSILKAPYSGTIARRFADDGTVVNTGQPILKLIEDTALEAWVGLPVEASVGVANNSVQRVRIADRMFRTRVSGRRPEVDPATRTRMVILSLDKNASAYVVHGQIVRLQLEETVAAIGFWLPTTALTEGKRGLWSCLVAVPLKPSVEHQLFRVERRDVEVLHTQSDRVLVRGTVSSDDRIVTRGTHRISPGQIVRLSDR